MPGSGKKLKESEEAFSRRRATFLPTTILDAFRAQRDSCAFLEQACTAQCHCRRVVTSWPESEKPENGRHTKHPC